MDRVDLGLPIQLIATEYCGEKTELHPVGREWEEKNGMIERVNLSREIEGGGGNILLMAVLHLYYSVLLIASAAFTP